MSNGRLDRLRFGTVLLLLVVLDFVLRPFLEPLGQAAPDLLLLALLVFSIRARPGAAAGAGFVTGIFVDSLFPVPFGTWAFAHTCVGYLAAWGKAVFFAENLLVNAVFFFVGTWVRDVLVVIVGGHVARSTMLWQLLIWSPLEALTTSLTGVVVLLVFRRWLRVRLTE